MIEVFEEVSYTSQGLAALVEYPIFLSKFWVGFPFFVGRLLKHKHPFDTYW